MENLIEALQIFLKYKNLEWPTYCEHDILFVAGYNKDEISQEDQIKLGELGFTWSVHHDCFVSYKYGSC